MQRTGTLSIGRTSAIARKWWNLPVTFCRASFRGSRKTGRSGVNWTSYLGPMYRPSSIARFSTSLGRNPSLGDQLGVLVGQVTLDGREVAPPNLVDVPVGVHQPFQERLSLLDRGAQVDAPGCACARGGPSLRSVLESEWFRIVTPGCKVAGVPRAADPVEKASRPLRQRPHIRRARPPSRIVRVCTGDLGLGRRSVSEPDSEHIGIDRQLPLWVPDRAGKRNVVVELAATIAATLRSRPWSERRPHAGRTVCPSCRSSARDARHRRPPSSRRRRRPRGRVVRASAPSPRARPSETRSRRRRGRRRGDRRSRASPGSWGLRCRARAPSPPTGRRDRPAACTRSSVDPSTNSPGCRMNASSPISTSSVSSSCSCLTSMNG